MITSLKDIETATLQEIFDQVAKHLLTQNRKSINRHSDNALIDELGNKCAIGCLMSEDELKGIRPDTGVYELVRFKELSVDISSPTYELLRELQSVHDNCVIDCWRESLGHIARNYRLDFKF